MGGGSGMEGEEEGLASDVRKRQRQKWRNVNEGKKGANNVLQMLTCGGGKALRVDNETGNL